LGVCFWSYLSDRIRGLGQVVRLRELIAERAKEKATQQADAVLA